MIGRKILLKTFLFLMLLCSVYVGQESNIIDTRAYMTHHTNGVKSIITGVFLHLNTSHLVGNVSILLVIIPLLLALYHNHVTKIFFAGILVPSIVMYLLSMPVVGISGLVYTILWFLVFSGLGSKDVLRFVVSILLMCFFSQTLIGITALAGMGIAWQAHLAGFIVGVTLAFLKMFK